MSNESAPIQLAQCRFPGLAISSAKILLYFSNKKYTEAILPNSTRKPLRFEITKILIAVQEKKLLRNLLQFSPHFRCLEPTRQSQGDKPERMRKYVIFSASDESIADKWSIDTADSQSGTCPAVFGCRWMDGCGADICYHARDSVDFIGKRLSQVATTKRRLYRGWAKNRTVFES